MNSFYYAVTLMLTVGFGDIVAQNNLEKIFTSISILLACACFGYIMNVIGNVLNTLSEKEAKLKFFIPLFIFILKLIFYEYQK